MRTFHKFYFQIRQIVINPTTEGRTYGADKKKGKGNRLGVAQRVPGVYGSQISMTFGTWWSCHGHSWPLPPGYVPGTRFH